MVSIDASVFLGMNCSNHHVRISCKNLIIDNMQSGILMSFEEVGKCDNEVWNLPNELQDAYFLFMDRIMSYGNFIRKPYEISKFEKTELSIYPLRYLLSKLYHSTLYTLKSSSLEKYEDYVCMTGMRDAEAPFLPNELEKIYVESRKIEFQLWRLERLA